MRFSCALGLVCAVVAFVGCAEMDNLMNTSAAPASDGGGSAQSGGSASAAEPEAAPSYVDVWLDGQKAEKQASGVSRIAKPISAGPKLRYEINDKAAFGNVNSTIINIFASTGSGWSTATEYIVLVMGGEKKMLPGQVYDLGAGSKDMMVMNRDNKTVSGVKLESGKRYLMNFVVSGDQSETASVEFTTR